MTPSSLSSETKSKKVAIYNDAIHVDHFSFFDSDLIENLRASEEQQSTEQQPKEEPTKK